MQRVMIMGQPGSGKSTLARALGAATGLPVFHMDHIHWLPNWVEREGPEKRALMDAVHAKPAWVFEGGGSVSYPERIARADTVIWLDRPVGLRFWRVMRRTLSSLGKNRPDTPAGCPERLDAGSLEFWRYIWRTRKSGRDKLAQWYASVPPGTARHHLRSDADVAAFLSTVSPTPDAVEA